MNYTKYIFFILFISAVSAKHSCDVVCWDVCNLIYTSDKVFNGLCINKTLCRCYVFNEDKTSITKYDIFQGHGVKVQ